MGTRSTTSVEQTAQDVNDSSAVEWLARLGLASRGLVWLVVALLAGSIVLGGSAQADQQGALRAIADKPFGTALLVVLVVGFFGYALWQALEAATGHRAEREDKKRLVKRLKSAGKALLYVSLALSVLRFLSGSGSSGDKTESNTAKLMQQPFGRWLVGLVGLVVLGVAVYLVLQAWKRKHAKKIEAWKVPQGRAQTAIKIGTVGLLGRGLVVGLIGAFLVGAALQADPDEAKGLDEVLHTLAEQAFGKVLLSVAVVALLAYAVWSFIEAAYHRHESSAA